MTEAVVVALIASLGVFGAAVVTGIVTAAGLLWRRMLRAEQTNVSLWTYTRLLVDHIYRGNIGPPPPPPEYIRHLYEGNEQ